MGIVANFGASNQMLAALTLMVLTLYFGKRKPILPFINSDDTFNDYNFSALMVNAISFYGINNTLFIFNYFINCINNLDVI